MEQSFSRETPQARVEWHLACLEARRRGEREPLAPWQQSPDTSSPLSSNHLTLPPRPLSRHTTEVATKPRTPAHDAPESTHHDSQHLLAEKRLALEYLLIRGGVPRDILHSEERVSQILEAYASFVKRGGERSRLALLHKHEIGRHFLVRGGAHNAIELADAVLPLLAATSAKEVSARERHLHRVIDNRAATINLPPRSAST
jgi:hypothetical protein